MLVESLVSTASVFSQQEDSEFRGLSDGLAEIKLIFGDLRCEY